MQSGAKTRGDPADAPLTVSARKPVIGVALLALVGLPAAALGVFDGRDDGTAGCGSPELAGLAPEGAGPGAFTMGVRVNQPSDVEEIDSEIGDRVLERDVFVVNTEYSSSDSGAWSETVDELQRRFPCNRIAALNGLGSAEGRPGYRLALAGEPELDAVLIDWEQISWEAAGLGAWDRSLARNLRSMEERLGEISGGLASKDTRVGLAPEYLPSWDYGRIARVLGELNWRLDSAHRGWQVVQTQPNCGDAAAPGPDIGALARELQDQYRPLFGLAPGPKGWRPAAGEGDAIVRRLGFEIGFSSTPNPKSSEPIDRVGPEEAAACSRRILDAGGAAILYWAAPPDMKAMLDTTTGRSLRPPGSS